MAIKCPKCNADNPDTKQFCGDCGTHLPSIKDIEVTETIEAPKEELIRGTTLANRYEIIEELGKGGMGRVYRVEDTKLKQEIALKLIKPEIAKDKKTIERFRNELKLAREIAHRNVCRMYDLNEEKGTHYITMEYVRGEDLRSLIRRIGQLPIGKSISIVKQICEGLSEAHRLGVVHRDLKSNNIMIDKEGNVRIMDFGIARSLEAKGITGAGVMIGTAEYMSPEQVEGEEVDQRSDIYSLGVILYEMVTGQVPFEGDTPFTVGMKHKSQIPKDPKEFNTQISDDLSYVILKCLEKNCQRRYQSIKEVLSELINVEKQIPKTDTNAAKRDLKIDKALGKHSIAVLPFADLSPQGDQKYFCDGLAEELLNALTKVENLQVSSRTSAFQLKEKGCDIQDIGEKLKVETVLEGSVRKAGDRLRITAQLVNVDDGYHIWSEKYDRNMEDIFAIQDEVTLAIVDKLKVKLLGGEKEKLLKRHTKNIEAYNLYLKGRYFWNKRNEKDLKKAINCFESSIKKDPDYALPHAGLADSYISMPYYSDFSPKESYPRAQNAANEAIKKDSTLAEAYTSLACSKALMWDWKGAEDEFKQAIKLNPEYANAHHWYSNFLMYVGRFEESFHELQVALNLDPLSLIINRDLGELFYYSRNYDKAIEQFHKAIDIDPHFSYLHLDLGISYLQKKQYKEALIEIKKEASDIWLGIAFAHMGNKDKAIQLHKKQIEKSEHTYVSQYMLALLCFALGENDKGFGHLDKALEEHNSWLVYAKIDPLLDSIKSDQRFKEILKKLGLEQ